MEFAKIKEIIVDVLNVSEEDITMDTTFVDDLAKAKCCARNLRAGKCQDPFIKETLGAILFPQHYGKRK